MGLHTGLRIPIAVVIIFMIGNIAMLKRQLPFRIFNHW